MYFQILKTYLPQTVCTLICHIFFYDITYCQIVSLVPDTITLEDVVFTTTGQHLEQIWVQKNRYIYNVFFNYFMVILHVRSILMIRDDQIDIWTSFCEFICTIYNDTCIIRSISLRRNNIYCHNISIRNATNILICSQFYLIMLLNWFAQ